jgi:hypothetical protein
MMGAAAASALAAGRADVGFTDPERFTDAGPNAVERERTQRLLREHIEHLAARLPDGQVLRVQVSDIDLAGVFDPFIDGGVRVVGRVADAPRITLRYTLSAGDRALASGEARLTDMAYLERGVGPHRGSPLEYERRLLDDWFAEQVLPKAQSVR